MYELLFEPKAIDFLKKNLLAQEKESLRN